MKKKIHFITYGNNVFKNSKKRIRQEANNCNWFDSITLYGPEDLSQEFRTQFKDILKQQRGGGYWIWKFDIIKQHLAKLNNNDILIYLDSGCTINIKGKKRFDEYIEMLNNSDETIISFQLNAIEKKYTIKELFHHFNMNINDNNINSRQFVAGILIMKNTDKIMKLINECINVIRKDQLMVTDHYNKMEQCNDFICNRHDQSILSLVRKKYGSIVIKKDETYFTRFGNKESLQYPFWATRKK